MPLLKRISVWTRRPEQAEALAAEIAAALDLAAAVATADIISTATMARGSAPATMSI